MLRKIVRFMVHSSWFMAKELFLCLFSAVLLTLSFPNFNLWILAWFGFVPFFFMLQGKSKGRAFLLSYLSGVVFWVGTIYWLVHVTFIGTFVLILYLALYFGIFGLVVSQFYLLPTTYYLLLLPSSWVLLEYIRAHLFTGFPWALLGYSQCLNLPIIQIADITGAWGVSFLVIVVNVLIYSVARCSCLTGRQALPVVREKQKFFLPLLIIFFVLVYGYFKLLQANGLTGQQATIKVSVIQGNIPQELKWEPGARDFIIDKYFSLTAQAVKESPDLVIWPEAAMPCVLEEAPVFYEKVKEFAKRIKTPLLLGAVTAKDDDYYNSALFISSGGKLLNRYDKLHLVPFGEYIPLKKILPFLETVVPIGDITAGKEYTIFYLDRESLSRYPLPDRQAGVIPLSRSTGNRPTGNGQTKFSVLICFEDLFPELSRQFVKKGANFLVNITNDAWYKKSSAPFQHLQASVFRAVENRVYLARAANTGISGFILPTGKIISLVQDKFGRDIFVDGYGTKGLFLSKRNLTFYTHFGDVFIVVCVLFMLYGITPKFKNLRHKTWRIRQGFWRKN